MKLPGNVLGGPIALIGLVVVGTCGCQPVSQHQPEILLFNGRIFTGAEPSFVESVSIRGSRVIAIGSTKELAATAGADARRIDLAGRFVIPGINDAHVHLDFFVPEHTPLRFEGLDPPCSLVLDRLREAVRTARKEIPIIGAIGQTAFFEEACTAQTLDRLAPAHAVILHTWTPHAAILNRSAVNMFSVQTANPPEGGSYGKDGRTTTWDGVIQEYAFFEFWAGLSKRVDDERARQILRGVLDEAVQLGITSLQAMTADPERLVRLLQDLNTPLRVRAILLPVAGVGKVKPHPRRQVSERFSYGDLKLILDGTPIERSAAMRKPYDDAPDSRGALNVMPERIREVVRESRESGYQLMLHAAIARSRPWLKQWKLMAQGGGSDASVWNTAMGCSRIFWHASNG